MDRGSLMRYLREMMWVPSAVRFKHAHGRKAGKIRAGKQPGNVCYPKAIDTSSSLPLYQSLPG